MSRDLVLFSTRYPSELTIATELEVLAPRFRRIVYLPSSVQDAEAPAGFADNVDVDFLLAGVTPSGVGRDLLTAAPLLLSHGADQPASLAAHMRALQWMAREQVARARALERFVAREGLRDAVFYDYWFQDSATALALLRKRGVIRRCVARAHRFDLYDDPESRWAVPFRAFKARQCDRIVSISRHGRDYLAERLPSSLHARLVVQRLGVPPRSVMPPPDGIPLLVSASHMMEHKQVHLIPEMLAGLDRPVRWVHFGDGPFMDEARRRAASLPARVECEFRGNVAHDDLLRFYAETPVSLLISLSASEGIPVSMMEAISFGIPVLAYGVTGIPELVDDTTGVLLEPGSDPSAATPALRRALDPAGFDRQAIADVQRRRFDARTNYDAMADLLLAL